MRTTLLFKVVACTCATLLVLSCFADAQGMSGPPVRPDVFHSPEELRDYLKALNEYFAIVGRPRFGRSVEKRSMLSAFRRSLGASPYYNALDLDE